MRVYLDLDDVLADFVGGACVSYRVPLADLLARWPAGVWDIIPPLSQALDYTQPLSSDQLWGYLGTVDFWENLQPLPWLWDVVAAVCNVAIQDWYILTAPPPYPYSLPSYTGKTKWVKHHLGASFDRLILTERKHLFAGPDAVLIDDKEENIQAFIRAGGQGILFPRHHNRLHAHKDDPVAYVKQELATISAIANPSRTWGDVWRGCAARGIDELQGKVYPTHIYGGG